MRILITGIGGQDGSYLAEVCLAKGHEVFGIVRRSSYDNASRVAHIRDRITIRQADLSDPLSIHRVIKSVHPSVIFNLADQDEVPFSFATPAQSMDITAGATVRLLEMVRTDFPWATVFQPISSTVFGDIPIARVGHPLFPMSPYAIAKAAALHACHFYRQHYGVRVFAGIMYNHDSPRRKRGYLLDTIIEKVRRCEDGGVVTVGNPCSAVDIGYAYEYMKAAHDLVFSDADPGDFIFATGDPRGVATLVGVAAELECKSIDVASDPDYDRSPSSITGSAEETERAIGWHFSTTADEVLRMKHGPKVDPSRLK